MINADGLSEQLKNINKQTLTLDITSGLQKQAQAFKVLNTDMVGRQAQALSDISKSFSKGLPDLNEITDKLTGALSISLPSGLTTALSNLEGIKANLKSSLPRAGEELNNGIKGLSSVLNDFPTEIASGTPVALKAATTVATNLQTAMPGLQKTLSEVTESLGVPAEKIKPEIGSTAATSLGAISGTSVGNNFNNIALALPTPAAVAEVVAAIGKATENVVPGLEAITSLDIEATLTSQLDGIKGDLGGINATLSGIGSLSSTLSGVLSKLDLPDLSLPDIGGILEDGISDAIGGLTTGLQKKIDGLIPSITGSPILDTLHKANNTLDVMRTNLGISANIPLIDDILGDAVKEFTDKVGITGALSALDILKNTSNLGINITANLGEFESTMMSLQGKFGSASKMLQLQLPDGVVSTSDQEEVQTLARTQIVVNNAEEVHAEHVSSVKQPKAMEISWTETYLNEVVNKDTIQPKDYYHYIVLQNGMTERDKAIGNDELIRVAVVAGYNVDKGEKGILTARSVSYTQALAVKRLMEQAIRALPGINIYGKGEFITEGGRGGGSIDPGMDISKIRKSIDGGTGTPPNAEAKKSDLGYPSGSRVVYLGGTVKFQKTRTRPLLIQARLMRILEQAAEENNVWLTIHSGGQMARAECISKGGWKKGSKWYLPGVDKAVRQGSTRHDLGRAADFSIYSDANRKNALNPSVNQNPPSQIEGLIKSAIRLGITGAGTGPNYMAGLIHLDYSKKSRSWWAKKGASPPPWLTRIMRG